MRIALTGHRPQRLGLSNDETSIEWLGIEHWLIMQIAKMSEGNTVDLYCGMASG